MPEQLSAAEFEQLQSDLQPDEPLRFFRGFVVGIGVSLCVWMLGVGAWLVLA